MEHVKKRQERHKDSKLSVSTGNPQYRHEKYNEFDEQIKF
jgi:hypothetical protein